MSDRQPRAKLARIGTADELRVIEAALTDQCGGVGPELVTVAEAVSRSHDGEVEGPCYLPWIRRPESLAPVQVAFRRALSGAPRSRWIDLDGTSGECGPGFYLTQSVRVALFLLLDCGLRCVANLLARFGTEPDSPPVATAGPLTIVLPVLPDLSHTFVYREAIALRALEPGCRIVVLERGGDHAPTHPESLELLRHAEFVVRDGVLRRALRIAQWIARYPHRCARLFASYRRPSADGSTGGLFGKLPLREPRHPGNAFALASQLARIPSGPIHVYGSTYAANAALGAGVLLQRSCSITSYVDFDFGYAHRMLQTKLEASSFFRVCTGFCRERLRTLVPSVAARLGDSEFDARVPVILFGIPLAAWQPRPDPGPGDGVLFTACRLVPKKGLHCMPPALAALRRAGVTVAWRVAGDGPERPRLERLLDEHGVRDLVTFLGAIANDSVHREILGCDLAVLPCVIAPDGERDGIPIFLNEAMACAVPVLTTRVSGIPELIEDGVSGFLVEPEAIDALSARLVSVLRDGDLRAKVAAGGRRAVVAKLDIEESARQLRTAIRGEPTTSP